MKLMDKLEILEDYILIHRIFFQLLKLNHDNPLHPSHRLDIKQRLPPEVPRLPSILDEAQSLMGLPFLAN